MRTRKVKKRRRPVSQLRKRLEQQSILVRHDSVNIVYAAFPPCPIHGEPCRCTP